MRSRHIIYAISDEQTPRGILITRATCYLGCKSGKGLSKICESIISRRCVFASTLAFSAAVPTMLGYVAIGLAAFWGTPIIGNPLQVAPVHPS